MNLEKKLFILFYFVLSFNTLSFFPSWYLFLTFFQEYNNFCIILNYIFLINFIFSFIYLPTKHFYLKRYFKIITFFISLNDLLFLFTKENKTEIKMEQLQKEFLIYFHFFLLFAVYTSLIIFY